MDYVIHVQVRNKRASQVGSVTYICGNSDYKIHIDFDGEWAAHPTKTARFTVDGVLYPDVIFTGSQVAIPKIMRGKEIRFGVFAGDLTVTTPAVIYARESILSNDGPPADPQPDMYAQIMEKLNEVSGGGASEADIAAAVEKYLQENPVQVQEADPTVPEWAKAEEKPKYTAEEVGAATKESVEKLSEDMVKSVNGVLPDKNGNVKVEVGDGEYELIETIVPDDDMIISRTQKPDGTAYNLKKVLLILSMSADLDASNSMNLQFSTVEKNANAWFNGVQTNGKIRHGTAKCETNGEVTELTVTPYTNTGAGGAVARYYPSLGGKPIVKITTTAAIKRGQEVQIWGVQA